MVAPCQFISHMRNVYACLHKISLTLAHCTIMGFVVWRKRRICPSLDSNSNRSDASHLTCIVAFKLHCCHVRHHIALYIVLICSPVHWCGQCLASFAVFRFLAFPTQKNKTWTMSTETTEQSTKFKLNHQWSATPRCLHLVYTTILMGFQLSSNS